MICSNCLAMSSSSMSLPSCSLTVLRGRGVWTFSDFQRWPASLQLFGLSCWARTSSLPQWALVMNSTLKFPFPVCGISNDLLNLHVEFFDDLFDLCINFLTVSLAWGALPWLLAPSKVNSSLYNPGMTTTCFDLVCVCWPRWVTYSRIDHEWLGDFGVSSCRHHTVCAMS